MDQNSTYFFHTGKKCDLGLPRLNLRCQQGCGSFWRLWGRICCYAYLRCWPGLVPQGGGPQVPPPLQAAARAVFLPLPPSPSWPLCGPPCGPLPQPAAVYQSFSFARVTYLAAYLPPPWESFLLYRLMWLDCPHGYPGESPHLKVLHLNYIFSGFFAT